MSLFDEASCHYFNFPTRELLLLNSINSVNLTKSMMLSKYTFQ